MWKQLSGIRGKFLPVFLTGFAAGVLYMALFGRSVVHETTLLSRYFFSKYQQVEFASGELFLYILKSRMSAFTLLWLTGFTFFGTAASLLALAWVGISLGITMTTAAMKLGFSGMLICLASGLPQLILVCTGCGLLLRKISEMSENRERRSSPIQRRQGTAAFLSAGLVAGIFPVFPRLPARKLCKSLFLRAVLKIFKNILSNLYKIWWNGGKRKPDIVEET